MASDRRRGLNRWSACRFACGLAVLAAILIGGTIVLLIVRFMPTKPAPQGPAPPRDAPAAEPTEAASEPEGGPEAEPMPELGPIASPEAAIERVRGLPDVKKWMDRVAAASQLGEERHALLRVEEETEESYTVHAFESVDTTEGGHTATFAWYEVDKATGGVVKDKY